MAYQYYHSMESAKKQESLKQQSEKDKASFVTNELVPKKLKTKHGQISGSTKFK